MAEKYRNLDSRDHVLQARSRDIPGINNVWVPRRLDFGDWSNIEPRIMALERWGDEKHRKYGLLRGLDQLFQVQPLISPLIIAHVLIVV